MSYLPSELHTALQEHFSFPSKHIFGSVATYDHASPHIRMMRIYDIDKEGAIVLLTHVNSGKWREFTHHPYVAINLVSENKLVQMITRGPLQLLTPQHNAKQLQPYWDMIRPDVKRIYHPDYQVSAPFTPTHHLSIPQELPITLGIARLVPDFWELLVLDSDYVNSQRYQFRKKEGQWQKQRITVG